MLVTYWVMNVPQAPITQATEIFFSDDIVHETMENIYWTGMTSIQQSSLIHSTPGLPTIWSTPPNASVCRHLVTQIPSDFPLSTSKDLNYNLSIPDMSKQTSAMLSSDCKRIWRSHVHRLRTDCSMSRSIRQQARLGLHITSKSLCQSWCWDFRG